MVRFYRGVVEGSCDDAECLISAKTSLEAENKMLSYYDSLSSRIGELLNIGIYNIEASEYYGAIKYQSAVCI